MDNKFTHLNSAGEARMVDVSDKNITERIAEAEAWVYMQPETLQVLLEGRLPKGDLFATARIAGIQAAKKCADLIPLCHPLALTKVTVDISPVGDNRLHIITLCKVDGKTGVEMEALTAASVTALTIYDMCKAIDKGLIIRDLRLLSKRGGKSGDWKAQKRV